eukprot:m.8445 g.8445  ORF g.8445 m.8445 type:complete len:492 (-) comp2858_c0_seq2:298-1773(-)
MGVAQAPRRRRRSESGVEDSGDALDTTLTAGSPLGAHLGGSPSEARRKRRRSSPSSAPVPPAALLAGPSGSPETLLPAETPPPLAEDVAGVRRSPRRAAPRCDEATPPQDASLPPRPLRSDTIWAHAAAEAHPQPWCRLCGAVVADAWRDGPWGPNTICCDHSLINPRAVELAPGFPSIDLTQYQGHPRSSPIVQDVCCVCLNEVETVERAYETLLVRCLSCPRAFHRDCHEQARHYVPQWICRKACGYYFEMLPAPAAEEAGAAPSPGSPKSCDSGLEEVKVKDLATRKSELFQYFCSYLECDRVFFSPFARAAHKKSHLYLNKPPGSCTTEQALAMVRRSLRPDLRASSQAATPPAATSRSSSTSSAPSSSRRNSANASDKPRSRRTSSSSMVASFNVCNDFVMEFPAARRRNADHIKANTIVTPKWSKSTVPHADVATGPVEDTSDDAYAQRHLSHELEERRHHAKIRASVFVGARRLSSCSPDGQTR